jgi:hypothetical protein
MATITAELPVGFARADGGVTSALGTQTQDGQIVVTHPAGSGIDKIPLEEHKDSPSIERGEQATFKHRWRMEWNEALLRLSGLGRGTVRQGTWMGLPILFRVLTAGVDRETGGMATLTVTEESMSFDSPPDRFQVTPVELSLDIIKHPRYFYAFLGPDGYGSKTEVKNQMVIRILQDYMRDSDANLRNAYQKLIYKSIGHEGSAGDKYPAPTWDPAKGWNYDKSVAQTISGTDIAKRAALEIINKWWRGEEKPYIIGWQINWSVYYFWPQPLNPGGYIEDPITQAVPQLPAYFWSPYFPPRDKPPTIFDWMAYVNPQCYSNTGYSDGDVQISWLRKADQYDFERTWFRVDRTWIGTPIGYWDPQLYNRSHRPQVVDDFQKVNQDGQVIT